MLNKWLLLILLCLAPLNLNSDYANYALSPDKSYIDNVHYDSQLNMIVVEVHASILWMTITEPYGIKVENNQNVEEVIRNLLGAKPEIIHLKKVK